MSRNGGGEFCLPPFNVSIEPELMEMRLDLRPLTSLKFITLLTDAFTWLSLPLRDTDYSSSQSDDLTG